MHLMLCVLFQDYYKHKAIEHILILSGDQLYRMDYMELVQVGDPLLYIVLYVYMFFSLTVWWCPDIYYFQKHVDDNADITLSCAPVGERYVITSGFWFFFSTCHQKTGAHADFFFVLEVEHLTMD